MEQRISIERMEQAVNIFGSFDENIRLLEKEFSVAVTNRDGELRINGEPEDVMHAAKIEYYTNIKADNLTPERLGWLIGYAHLCNKINCVAWDSDEVDAIINRAIEDRRCEIREKRAHDINALMDMVKALIDRFEHVGETLEGADIPALLGDIQKIANMDDEQRVRNVLTVHQESDGNS